MSGVCLWVGKGYRRLERRKGKEFALYRIRMEFKTKIYILSISSAETGLILS
jgi:hypothetical protein